MNAEKLSALYRQCAAYFDALYAPETRIYVFGDGDPAARILLVGEAPGEQETLLQKPFVGRAGKNLDEFLALTDLTRPKLYTTNLVKFRPVKLSAKGRASNRPPSREEIGLWKPWLLKELAIISPKVIVSLGNLPLQALTGPKTAIGQVHGRPFGEMVAGAALFPLYHPASVIYNPALRESYLEDLRAFALFLRENGL
ncbi:MAG: uracil-DNA glycosylase [Christensenellaceae bacterium]|jgi:DNA polymerase|nr:uracil-DNA glycosylase [Christensenellaceae bacterium]